MPNYRQGTLKVTHATSAWSQQLLLFIMAISSICILNPTMTNGKTLPDEMTETIDSSYFYIGCYTARTDLVKESIYAKIPQTCIEMCEHQGQPYAILAADKCFCASMMHEEERQDEQLCNTRCIANKAQYCGGVGVHSYYATSVVNKNAKIIGNQTPHQLRIAGATENSLIVSWQRYKPQKMFIAGGEVSSSSSSMDVVRDNTIPEVSNFLIRSQVVHTYSTLPFFPQPEFIVQSTETQFEITDLHPATVYNVSVDAICGGSLKCGGAWLQGTTTVGEPSPAPPQPRILPETDNGNDNTIAIEIPPLHNNNGPLTRIFIVVERVDAALSQPFDEQLLGDWNKAQEDGLPYYIAAELEYTAEDENHTRRFIIGDGNHYGRYTNAPLEGKPSDRHIHVSLGVVSTLNGITRTLFTRSTHDQHTPNSGGSTLEDFTYSTFESGSQSIVALTVICIIFATCLLLSVITYFYLRYRTGQTRAGGRVGARNVHEMTMQQPIIERENNGYVPEVGGAIDPTSVIENFKSELDTLLDQLPPSQRLARSALRMNVNDVLAEGRYGETISGKLITTSAIEGGGGGAGDCQLHVLALDELPAADQVHFLRELRNVLQLQQQPRNRHLLDFYGVSASADWFYVVFELQHISLKRRLVESRRAPISAPVQRVTSLTELLVLQWIYELASAMEYISSRGVVLRQLCSHSVFVTAEGQLKLSIFGPVHYVHSGNQKTVDLTRWMAPEVLRYQHHSIKSDIWSFACVAWECCALGGTPYASIAQTRLLLDAIKNESRPAQPAYVYHDLYQLLLNCWQLESSERATFEEILFAIRQLMTSPRHALCFDRAPEVQGGGEVLDVLPFYLPLMEVIN